MKHISQTSYDKKICNSVLISFADALETNIKNIEITKIMTPFFKTNRYLLKISV